ncbi:transposase family protein [Streptomyces sp. NPDC059582]|uniref:transposase family protein n=1 Tax=Streptomyces sp. NPDC059582 TaxID=3346875 RepID=UPI00369AA7AE
MRFLAITDTRGRLVWISASRRGRSSDITTARHNDVIEQPREVGLGAIGDLGFIGLDDDPDDPVLVTGFKAAYARPLTPAQKGANKLLATERAACEDAFAHLKNRHILPELRLGARHATMPLRALLVLTNSEVAR